LLPAIFASLPQACVDPPADQLRAKNWQFLRGLILYENCISVSRKKLSLSKKNLDNEN
jgi:hypothetical protein